MRRQGARRTSVLVGTALLLAIVALGVGLRAHEIRQTQAIGAEDPYTHVVFTQEWVEQGYFADSRHLGTSMYPPGMHAVLGVLAGVSGIDILTLAKWIPLAFAALAIVGTFALAQRLGGLAAGLGAASLVAVMPEHAFRTQLLFPTALDLALVPAWLLLFHEACRPARPGASWLPRDRVAAALLFVGISVPLAWMHPWAVPLFGVPALIYAGFRTIRAGGPFRVAARRMLLPALVVSLACAFAMASRWDEADTGFADFAGSIGPLAPVARLDLPAVAVFPIVLAALLAACAAGVLVVALLAAVRLSRRAALALSATVALVLAALVYTWPMRHALPQGVAYGAMLGTVAIVLGLAGLAFALLRPTPLGDMGLALGIVLAPLTAINVFSSPYWPARTVAYFSFAVALLGGAALGAIATVSLSRVRVPRLRAALVPTAAVATLLLVAGASVAAPVTYYDWYRLYDDDDYAAFQRLTEKLEAEPGARVFVQTWQPSLFVKALGGAEDMWYSPAFFKDAGTRADQMGKVRGEVYVLVEEHTRKEASKGRADLGFLEGERIALQSADRELVVYQLR